MKFLYRNFTYDELIARAAVSLYGLGSHKALVTTMGLFGEVPVMLSLVYLGKKLIDREYWRIHTRTEKVRL